MTPMPPTPVPGQERTECIRCGECCLRSTPSLHVIDIHRVTNGPINRSHLYTLRQGELVRDNVRGELRKTEGELVKVREKGESGACIFYHHPERRCTIYDSRPVQCAALRCWDDSAFMRVYAEPKASRKDLIQDGALLRLMEAHEERCAYARLDRLVTSIPERGDEAVEEILGMLKFDHGIRLLAPQKLGIDPEEMDLIFGRPLSRTISMFGLKVIREPDGSFLLTPLGPSSPD